MKSKFIEEMRKKRVKCLKRKLIPCEHCGKRTQINKLIYIQTHWYVRPHGCTDGDYWVQGEGQYICPKCGKENRLCDFNKREYISKLKRYFKEVVEKHGRN